MMQARTLMLSALGAGALTGAVLGATTTTEMKPSAPPPWKHTQRQQEDTSPAPSFQFVESGPQDLSPWTDRTPTWKRDNTRWSMPTYIPAFGPEEAYPSESPFTDDSIGSSEAAGPAWSPARDESTALTPDTGPDSGDEKPSPTVEDAPLAPEPMKVRI